MGSSDLSRLRRSGPAPERDRPGAPPTPGRGPAAQLLALQRAAGNHAVSRLLQRQYHEPGEVPAPDGIESVYSDVTLHDVDPAGLGPPGAPPALGSAYATTLPEPPESPPQLGSAYSTPVLETEQGAGGLGMPVPSPPPGHGGPQLSAPVQVREPKGKEKAPYPPEQELGPVGRGGDGPPPGPEALVPAGGPVRPSPPTLTLRPPSAAKAEKVAQHEEELKAIQAARRAEHRRGRAEGAAFPDITFLTAEHEAFEARQRKVVQGGKVVGPRARWRDRGTKFRNVPVRYLDEREREAYELKVMRDPGNPTFRWRDRVLDTTQMKLVGGVTGVDGRAIFVLTADGRMFVADQGAEVRGATALATKEASAKWRDPAVAALPVEERRALYDRVFRRTAKATGSSFHHSSFLGGAPVAAAGEIVMHAGVLKAVTDASGHYRPELKHMRQALQWFREAGVDLAGVELLLVGKGRDPDAVVPATLALDHPDLDEPALRAEAARLAAERSRRAVLEQLDAARKDVKANMEQLERLYREAVRISAVPVDEAVTLLREHERWAALVAVLEAAPGPLPGELQLVLAEAALEAGDRKKAAAIAGELMTGRDKDLAKRAGPIYSRAVL